MNYLIKESVEVIANKYNMRWSGSMWAGKQCPWCGSSRSGTDKFNFWPDGGWKCRSCEKTGDFISWLRDPQDGTEKMSCAEAHEAVNADCLSSSCPFTEKCRITKGERRFPKDMRSGSDTLPGNNERNNLNIVESLISPHPDWVKTMTRLATKAAGIIMDHEDVLQSLAARGVTKEMVEYYKIGYLPHDESLPIKDLGMERIEKGGYAQQGWVGHHKDKLWVPGGLFLPTFSAGNLFCFEVRRTAEMRSKYLPNIKYLFGKGGGRGYRSLWRGRGGEQPKAVVVIESKLDAVLVSWLCKEVAVMTGKDKPLSRAYAEKFKTSPLLLICTDNDDPNQQGLCPGEEKAKIWENEYDNAHFWPVPKGKDPGEYYRDHTGDIRAWIMHGIEKFSKKIFLVPDRPQTVSAENNSNSGKVAKNEEAEDVIQITIHGKIVYLVRNNDMLRKIAAPDRIVFSQQEFEILRDTFGKLSKENALKLFEIKEVFGTAAMMVTAARVPKEED